MIGKKTIPFEEYFSFGGGIDMIGFENYGIELKNK